MKNSHLLFIGNLYFGGCTKLKINDMINKLSDLQIGKEYFILLKRDKKLARKAILKAIINETEKFNSDRTEIYIALFQRGKLKSTNLLFAKEMGIGESLDEAYDNYGRFDYEENENFENSFRRTKELVTVPENRGLIR